MKLKCVHRNTIIMLRLGFRVVPKWKKKKKEKEEARQSIIQWKKGKTRLTQGEKAQANKQKYIVQNEKNQSPFLVRA